MATGDIRNVEIIQNGWHIAITFEILSDGGTYLSDPPSADDGVEGDEGCPVG